MLVVSGFFFSEEDSSSLLLSLPTTIFSPWYSGDEDHVELSHGDHVLSDGTEIVFTIDSVTDVQATIAYADEINVLIVLSLALQIVLNRHLDGLVWLILNNDTGVLTTSANFCNLFLDGVWVDTWFNDSDTGQATVITNHA